MDDLKAVESKDGENAVDSDVVLANTYCDISDADSDLSDIEKQPEIIVEILVSEKNETLKDNDQAEKEQVNVGDLEMNSKIIDDDNNSTEGNEEHGQLQDFTEKRMSLSDKPPSMSPASVEEENQTKYSDIDDEQGMEKDVLEESPETSTEDSNSGLIGGIQIQTITIDEDEDLFDFQHAESNGGIDTTEESKLVHVDNGAFGNEMSSHSEQIGVNLDNDESKLNSEGLEEEMHKENSQNPQELKKYELYKYLMASSVDNIKSSEVTPLQTPLQTPLASDHDSNEEEDSGSESDTSESGSYSSATSENDDHEELGQHEDVNEDERIEDIKEEESVQEPEQLNTEEPLVENNVVEKPKPTPVRKTFRPRLTKKMRSILAKTQERIKKSKEVTDKWLKELELPKNLDLSNLVKLNITDLNQYLTCGLCSGYLYEASTVTECMHTFCKTCIVKHCMEVSLNCPVCNILIHPTDPFVNIRLDRMIQDIVYKLLPDVADAEMKNIRKFYAEHPDVEAKELNNCPDRPKPSPAKSETCTETCPLLSLVLESESESPNEGDLLEKKYVRVKGTATVENLSHFLKLKLQLEDTQNVDIFCHGDLIEESKSTLQTLKEKFFSKEEECLLLLRYRVGDP